MGEPEILGIFSAFAAVGRGADACAETNVMMDACCERFTELHARWLPWHVAGVAASVGKLKIDVSSKSGCPGETLALALAKYCDSETVTGTSSVTTSEEDATNPDTTHKMIRTGSAGSFALFGKGGKSMSRKRAGSMSPRELSSYLYGLGLIHGRMKRSSSKSTTATSTSTSTDGVSGASRIRGAARDALQRALQRNNIEDFAEKDREMVSVAAAKLGLRIGESKETGELLVSDA